MSRITQNFRLTFGFAGIDGNAWPTSERSHEAFLAVAFVFASNVDDCAVFLQIVAVLFATWIAARIFFVDVTN